MRVQGEDYVVPGFLSASAADALQAGWMVSWAVNSKRSSRSWLAVQRTRRSPSCVISLHWLPE